MATFLFLLDVMAVFGYASFMKIYTATGDRGKTSLFSGERISKDHARIEAYGAVDELNAIIGALIAILPVSPRREELQNQLSQIQADLFQVGAWLATTPGSPSAVLLPPVTPAGWQRLEKLIDAIQSRLTELNAFILPGGHPSAGWAHLARTVCRRAERRSVALVAESEPNAADMENILIYLNRLSDYFFVLARLCNHLAGVKEIIWHG
jgi:cob(I)alamin adenosyltransferase